MGRTDGLSVIEFAVTPWDDLDWRGAENSTRSVLRAGKVIGIQLALTDEDGVPYEDGGFRNEGIYVIQRLLDAWWDASMFVDAVLCGTESCLPGSIPVSAVKADSWGRIKASFR